MNEIKDILVFLSLNPRPYLQQIFIHAIYFSASLLLTIPVFFLLGHQPLFFAAFVVVLGGFYIILKRIFLLRSQVRMNSYYVVHRQQGGLFDESKLSGNWKNHRVKLHQELADRSLRVHSSKLKLAILALVISGIDFSDLRWDNALNLIKASRRVILVEWLLLLLLLLPFAGVSLLFTLGFQVTGLVVGLIFLLCLVFVYFIKSAVLDPLFCLLVQKKACEHLLDHSIQPD